MTNRTLTANGLEFLVRDLGPENGEPVLALHGFPTTSASWTAVAERLTRAGRRVVAPDQRGYSPGARPDGVDAYTQTHLVADAVGILDALGLERAHVLGHDWGGFVAWALAGQHPDRVAGLTVASTPHPIPFSRALRDDPEQQEASRYMEFFRRPDEPEEQLLADDATMLRRAFGGSVEPELVDAYVERMREPGALTAALNWYRAMTSENVVRTGVVTVPTTYVWGARDAALRGGPARATGESVDAPYRFVELPEADHWLPETEPAALASAVLDPPR